MGGVDERQQGDPAWADEMVAWLTGVLDGIERAERSRVTLTRSVRGRPCPMPDEDNDPCGQIMSGVGFTAGDEQWTIEPCGHYVTCEQAFELLGAEPAADRAVLARVEAERATVQALVEEQAWTGDLPLRWLTYGHRFDAEGYDPAWAPDGVSVDASG